MLGRHSDFLSLSNSRSHFLMMTFFFSLCLSLSPHDSAPSLRQGLLVDLLFRELTQAVPTWISLSGGHNLHNVVLVLHKLVAVRASVKLIPRFRDSTHYLIQQSRQFIHRQGPLRPGLPCRVQSLHTWVDTQELLPPTSITRSGARHPTLLIRNTQYTLGSPIQ